jgi:hypothetical protein
MTVRRSTGIGGKARRLNSEGKKSFMLRTLKNRSWHLRAAAGGETLCGRPRLIQVLRLEIIPQEWNRPQLGFLTGFRSEGGEG